MAKPAKTGTYFDGEIDVVPAALIEMFGDEAPLRARERAGEYREQDGEGGPKFWMAVSDAATRQLDENRKS
jgi:hypothetical protein